MGVSQPWKSPRATFYIHRTYIDGRYGEKVLTFIVLNDCARFSTFGVEHEFILMNDEYWPHYKVYEWTIHNLKMYACSNVKYEIKQYLGIYPVSVVYEAALQASKGKKI